MSEDVPVTLKAIAAPDGVNASITVGAPINKTYTGVIAGSQVVIVIPAIDVVQATVMSYTSTAEGSTKTVSGNFIIGDNDSGISNLIIDSVTATDAYMRFDLDPVVDVEVEINDGGGWVQLANTGDGHASHNYPIGERTTLVPDTDYTIRVTPAGRMSESISFSTVPAVSTTGTYLTIPSLKAYGAWGQSDWEGLHNLVHIFDTDAGNPNIGAEQFEGESNLITRLVPSSGGTPHIQFDARLPDSRKYRLTQDVRFDSPFDWGGLQEGGKFGFGLAAGSASGGGAIQQDGCRIRYMWRGYRDGSNNAKIVSYVYSADMSSTDYGDDWEHAAYDIELDTWITLTMELELNSSFSTSDGSLRILRDGAEVMNYTGRRFQSIAHDGESAPVIDRILFENFYGGNNSDWSPSSPTNMRYRNIYYEAL